MKPKKNETKKFSLEKFEVAKLKNLHEIYGGTGIGDETATNGGPANSSLPCNVSRNSNPPCRVKEVTGPDK